MSYRRQLLQTAAATVVGVSLTSGPSSLVQASDPDQRWPMELEVGTFCIRCDFKLTNRRTLVNELRHIAGDLSRLLRVPSPQEMIYVVLFQTDVEYQRYMENYFPNLPKRRAMFLQDRGPGMLFTHWHQDVATDLRHEVTHALLNDGQQPLPLWLDEGLAEYFEVAPSDRFASHPYCAEVVKLASEGEIRSLDTLSQTTNVHAFSNAEYRDSWAWVHFMIHRQADTRQLLIRYLQEHRSGQAPFDLQRGLVQIVPNPEQELSRHFKSLS